MFAILFATALLLITLAALGAHDEQKVLQRWEFRLNPEGLRAYCDVAEELLWNRHMVDASCEDAVKAREAGSLEEAKRFLTTAAWILGHCSDGLLAMLRNLGKLARHAEAIAPMPPLAPHAFRLRRAAFLAGLHNLAHYATVTTRERLGLRLAVLRGCIRFCADELRRAVARTSWSRLEEARADLGTLTDESLLTLRSVLASLAAVRRPAEAPEQKTA